MSDAAIHPGARYYGAVTLPLYDAAVLRLVVPYAWGCPLDEEQALYDSCVGARHLDVGVASGYFLDNARWPVASPALTLMDLNPRAAAFAARRLQRFRPTVATGDALEPFPVSGPFDSVGLFHLLHCLPGPMAHKARALDHAARVLAPGGVVFGASVTPAGRALNAFARSVLAHSNRVGALNNVEDDHEALSDALAARFMDVSVRLRGCMTLWSAREPRPA